MKVQLMSPAADRVDFKAPPGSRLPSVEGKTIGLYKNMTGGQISLWSGWPNTSAGGTPTSGSSAMGATSGPAARRCRSQCSRKDSPTPKRVAAGTVPDDEEAEEEG
jgi:hypothetical protein